MRGLLFGLLGLVYLASAPANADAFSDKYKSVNLRDLTAFTVGLGSTDLTNLERFVEYMKIVDCRLYENIKDSQFKQQEVQNSTLAHMRNLQKENGADMYISIPITMLSSGYNFDTQSLTIVPSDRLVRVNTMHIYDDMSAVCGTGINQFTHMPIMHWVQLNFPVSLYRIPLQRSLAEALTNRLDRNRSNASQHIIYANILIQLERIQPEMRVGVSNSLGAVMRGQINAIDLFVDHERKVLFKRLNYIESF